MRDMLYLSVNCTFHKMKMRNSKQVTIIFLFLNYSAVGRRGLACRLHHMIPQLELPTRL